MIAMKRTTKDRVLTAKETHIENLINSGDKRYLDAFNFVYQHYQVDYLMNKSNHFLVFKAIYIKKLKLPKWKMALYCHVSRTTLFVYRHDIIDCFYTCINENVATEEISITKGSNNDNRRNTSLYY